jgi:hypothetical protein
MITNNRYIQEKGLTPTSTEMIGDSGLGKTSISLKVAQDLGIDHVKLNLAQIEELGDLVGFPVRQFQMKKGGAVMKPTFEKIGGKMVKKMVPATTEVDLQWVDETAVDEYSRNGYKFTNKKRMSYCPPEWIADKQNGGILILDDWNRADHRFIQAVMELVDRQEYISWKLPKDWHIILTANPDDGEYMVQSIDTAQRTRFVSTVLKWNHERWAEWAETAAIDTRCINFVLMHPEIVNARVNPRSLTTFFNCISSFDNFSEQLPMIQMVGEGSVGPEAATLFTTFINNNMDKLITPREVLLDESTPSVLDRLKACVNDDSGSYKASIASILSMRIINYTLHYAETNPITPEIIARVTALGKAEDVFTDDLKYVIVKKIFAGNKQKFSKMINDPEIQEMVMK